MAEVFDIIETEAGKFIDDRFVLNTRAEPERTAKWTENMTRIIDPAEVIAIYDDTFFRGGGDGFLLTANRLACSNPSETPFVIHYEKIQAVGVKQGNWIRPEKVTITHENEVSEIQIQSHDSKVEFAQAVAATLRRLAAK